MSEERWEAIAAKNADTANAWRAEHERAVDALKFAVETMHVYIMRDAIVRAGWNPYAGEGLELQRMLRAAIDDGELENVTVATVWDHAEAHGFTPDFTPPTLIIDQEEEQ